MAARKAVSRNVVRFFLDFVAGIGDGNGKSAVPHRRQVNHIVAALVQCLRWRRR
jgi:hypothetical protein